MSLNILGQISDETDFCPHVEEIVEKKEIRMDSEERYQLIADHASNMIVVIDPDNLCLSFVSPSFQKILGYCAKDILGHHCLEILYPDDREAALLAGIKVVYGGSRYRVVKNDGTVIWVELLGEFIYNEAGKREILIVAVDITERKITEDALQRAEEKYRLIVKNAYDGISIVNIDHYAGVYANPAVLKVLGYTEEEFAVRKELENIHPEDRDYALKAMAEGIVKRVGTAELRFQKNDGTYIWAEVTGRLLPPKDDQSEILFISRDISERKKADEALRRSELRLRQITDNMLDSICVLNENGIFEYVSPSHKSILGFEAVEMMGKQNINLVHPDDRRRVVKFFASTLKKGSSGRIEYQAQHNDGFYLWVESVGRVFFDNYSGVKQLVVVTRDITVRKQAEAELRQREEELTNKVNYLNTLIDNMNELCYTFDRDLTLTFGNQKAQDVTGYSLEEALGRSMSEFVTEIDKEKVLHEVQGRLEQGNTGSYEHFLICKNGSELLVKIKSSPIIENDEIVGVLVLAEDITQQRKIEKEMTRLGQLHTVGEMAASIGHEIRNPMTTVQGFLQIMSMNEKLREQQPYFDLMLEELGRANAIITEFLSLAKDKMVDLQCHNINKIVESLAPLLVADAIKGDKHISFMLGNVCDLLLDEKEIRQLILNLVRNGLEAMPAGGGIIIKTAQEIDGVVLSVRDEGVGIAPEIQDQLGTPFITSKENGTGLGLAVCYSIADRHHALLEYESSSAGTTFNMKFPTVSK